MPTDVVKPDIQVCRNPLYTKDQVYVHVYMWTQRTKMMNVALKNSARVMSQARVSCLRCWCNMEQVHLEHVRETWFQSDD